MAPPASGGSDAHPADLSKGVRVALASGVAVGGFLVALGQTSAAAGLWPLAVSRTVSVALFTALALATRQAMVVPRHALAPALACGGLDMVANALYLVAVREGQLSLVATLASLPRQHGAAGACRTRRTARAVATAGRGIGRRRHRPDRRQQLVACH